MNLFDRLEKLLAGYTTAERADIQRRYIDWRVERAIVASLERLMAEDEAADASDEEASAESGDQEVQPQ